MQATGCPNYPAVSIDAANQPTSIYYHDATFWRCWGLAQQQQWSGQVGTLQTQLAHTRRQLDTSHTRGAAVGWGLGAALVLALLLNWGLANGRRRNRFALAQLRALIAADVADDRHQVGVVQARIEHERDDQRNPISRLWLGWPVGTTIDEVLASAQAVQRHIQARFDPKEQVAVDQARVNMLVAQRGQMLEQDMRQAIPLAVRDYEMERQRQQHARWLAVIGAANRVTAAMVGATAELRNNPALADVVASFQDMQTVIQRFNPDAAVDTEALSEMISQAVTQTVARNLKVSLK